MANQLQSFQMRDTNLDKFGPKSICSKKISMSNTKNLKLIFEQNYILCMYLYFVGPSSQNSKTEVMN